MKKTAVVIILLFSLVLVSCGSSISGSEAKSATAALFKCISEENYSGAAALFHPDTEIKEKDIEGFFENLAEQSDADFSKGFSVKYTGFKSSLYDSDYGGGHYELRGIAEVDGVKFDLTIEFIKRNDSFGIYIVNLLPQNVHKGSDDKSVI